MTTYQITLNPSNEGRIVAECPALPGCVSYGRTEQEAVANIKEAITAWMWDAGKHATPLCLEPMALAS